MLVHHDSRDYAVAASDAAAHARTELEALIEKGRTRATAVLEQIERDVPQDTIVAARASQVIPTEGRLRFQMGDGLPVNLHHHAKAQLAQRVGMPWQYLTELERRGDWGLDLAADNVNRLLRHQADARYLVRTVNAQGGHEVRGILSDRFRRLDSRPIVDAFCRAANEIGAVPIEGYALETKIGIKAILPMVFEPVPNEVMAFGAYFGNSDFGDGAEHVRMFLLRLWCTNYAITEEALRQVHLGGKLPDDVIFSERTYRLDTERAASMVNDVMQNLLGPERINKALATVKAANEANVTGAQIKDFFKKHLTVAEQKDATEAFAGPDIVNLPPGQTAWRLSNAVSWIARNTEDENRRLDLMKVAALALPSVN